jgi:hydrogenase maturation protease
LEQKQAIACLGNPILGDDAFGLLVAKELEGTAGAKVITMEGGGLDMAVQLIPYSRVLIIDALETASGEVGELVSLTMEELSSMKGLEGHALSLAQAVEALRLLSGDSPRTVDVLACRIRPVTTYGETISPAVCAAVAPCAKRARGWISSGHLSRNP